MEFRSNRRRIREGRGKKKTLGDTSPSSEKEERLSGVPEESEDSET